MTTEKGPASNTYKEIIFQVILHLIVFSFYSFDRNQTRIEAHQVSFFLNYAAWALIINYIFLPRLFYREKYVLFALLTLLAFGGVLVVEELVLERIYFSETRGKGFPGSLFSLFGIFPVVAILAGFKFAWDALQKQQEVRILKAAVEKSELQFLTSQINPHFLFNNLNNLYSHAIENSPKTPEIILELSAVLRYMLYECKEPFVLLSKEVEQLENFTRLNQLQIEDRGHVRFSAPANIPSDYRIAPLILIVFIENAFKHSQSCQTENINIEIDLEFDKDGQLEFRCKNSYQALQNNENIPHGIGLDNVRKRLQMIYPHEHKLDIRSDRNQYEVYLRISLCSYLDK